jgi:flagellar biosynthetic protein FliP
MTFNMTLPMVALMRYRGHMWDRCGEMAAAMFVLAFALLVPFWLGALSADAVLPLEMALMLPAMVAVMALRFEEYAGPRGSASVSAERAP